MAEKAKQSFVGRFQQALRQDTNLSPMAAHALWVLASHGNADGTSITVGTARLAAEMKVSKATLMRHRVFEESTANGWLEKVRDATGTMPVEWRLTTPSGLNSETTTDSVGGLKECEPVSSS